MITGLMVLDSDDHVVFEPNPNMLDPVLGHTSLLEDLSEQAIILYGKSTYQQNLCKLHPEAKVYVGESLEEIKAKHPLTSVIVVGNKTVLRNIDEINNLMVIKYRSQGINPGKETFHAPEQQPVSTTKLVNYDILTYRLNNEPTTILTA
jgi:hypothetical protein